MPVPDHVMHATSPLPFLSGNFINSAAPQTLIFTDSIDTLVHVRKYVASSLTAPPFA